MMKTRLIERRSGKDRRALPRHYFGTQFGDRRKNISLDQKEFDEEKENYWPQAV